MKVNPSNSTNEAIMANPVSSGGTEQPNVSIMHSDTKKNIKKQVRIIHTLIDEHDISNIKIILNSLTQDNCDDFLQEYVNQYGTNIIHDLNRLSKDENSAITRMFSKLGVGSTKPIISKNEIGELFNIIKNNVQSNTLTANLISATELLHTLNTDNIANVKKDLQKKITAQNAVYIFDNYQAVSSHIDEYAGTDKEIKMTKSGFYKSAQNRPMRCESVFQGILKCPAFSASNKQEQKECIQYVIDKIAENARANNVPEKNIKEFSDFAKKDLNQTIDNYYNGNIKHMSAYESEKKFISLIGEPLWGKGYISL